MPRLAQQLSDMAVRKARPKAEPYIMASGRGLYLVVLPTGAKQWLVRYKTPKGKGSKKVVGLYPEMGVADAHKAAEELHQQARMGEPAAGLYDRRRAAAQAKTQGQIEADRLAREARENCFTVRSDAWLESCRGGWAPATYNKAVFIVRKKLQPHIGALDMRTMASKDVVGVLRQMGTDAPSLARKARQYLNAVTEYCIQRGIRGDDQVLRLRGVLPKHRGGHIPAITQIQGIGPLMRAILAYDSRVTRGGLLLAAYTACRPGVVAAAAWSEIDLDRAEWTISAAKMKTRVDHVVSLPHQALDVLEEMRQYSNGEFVFPGSQSNEHMHRDALSKALRAMGFQGQHATHGFRAMLRTVARERLKIDVDVLEAQLAHAKKGEVQAAYDRARFEDERRRVMEAWADFLHDQAEHGNVVAIRRGVA